MSKKIQVRTVEMKANAEVIVLNSAFVARTTKCLIQLEGVNFRVRTEMDRYPEETNYIRETLTRDDLACIADATTLLQDIYDAFTGEEDKPEEKIEK